MSRIPSFRLSHGQVAWTLNEGQEPTALLLAQLRYLRRLGIPFTEAELGKGRGRRVLYDFEHLIEIGIAFEALRFNIQPRFIKGLIEGRAKLRPLYRKAFRELPEAAWKNPAIKSRGKQVSIPAEDYFLHFHYRFNNRPGTLEMVGLRKTKDVQHLPMGAWVDQLPGEPPHVVIALKQLILRLVTWAREAPETRPGPKT